MGATQDNMDVVKEINKGVMKTLLTNYVSGVTTPLLGPKAWKKGKQAVANIETTIKNACHRDQITKETAADAITGNVLFYNLAYGTGVGTTLSVIAAASMMYVQNMF